ncbi:MAG: hypothetical protein CSA23_02775 [Deltaproteobacteria bacterium]|nr:MAG: hypothetical protein CSA23_02775 [Deltaproteobacteria bacterium]
MVTRTEKIHKIIKKDRPFTQQNQALCFLAGNRIPTLTAGDGPMGRVQEWLKRWGRLYYLLLYLFAPVMPSRAFSNHKRRCLDDYGEEQVILNLGSGPQRISRRGDIINVDIFAFDQVDMVADATDLPIENDSVDLILNTAMLEHVNDPQQVVSEMNRVIVPGGRIFCFIPFIVPFHAAPYDYMRWTVPGCVELFSVFDKVEIGIGAGPMSGFLYVLVEWLAIVLSFGSRSLHDWLFMLFLIIISPFKILDLLLVHFPHADRIAAGFYVVGEKKM